MNADELLRTWGENERAAAARPRVPVERFAAPRRRRRWAILAAALIVVLAVAINLVAARLTGSDSGRPGSGGPYDASVLRDGATVVVTGEVLAVPGRPVQLCAPRARYDTGNGDAQSLPSSCPGITATGVDLSNLAKRVERNGTVQGTATLTGIYRDHALTVTRQQQPNLTGDTDLPEQPPCPAPASGWPPGAGNTGDDSVGRAWEAAHPGAVLIGAIMHPLPGHLVIYALLGADQDPAAVREAWQPFYKDHLCVYRSRYTHAELRAVYDAFDPRQPVWAGTAPDGIGIGTTLTPQAEVRIDIELDYVTPAIAELATRQPTGLVNLSPWIKPIT
jgi:hypothetical protein